MLDRAQKAYMERLRDLVALAAPNLFERTGFEGRELPAQLLSAAHNIRERRLASTLCLFASRRPGMECLAR
jgi:hypothetical protein